MERGEGLILRKVSLRVDKVLWSRAAPARTAPVTFDWTAHGWQFTGDTRTKMAGEDQPRIEKGHRYVMALQREPPRCDPDDGDTPGRWRGLGAESTTPYDNGALGQGESQGHVQPAGNKLTTPAASPGDPEYSLRDEFTGRTAEDLARRLSATTPGTPETFQQRALAAECAG
ncbi:hypothetical protein ACPEIF_08895 [Streptomyces sp. NPDC012600]|uniref:hypothetical protein n=1 Tax=Streptomyces sp. NPDC012600 TaxID=3415005 RepID=UPI003C30AFBE